jgi:exodeoxyribonuclease VII large subunit
VNLILALNFEISENKILLSGETFLLKDQIKMIGGRWNAQEKKWWISHSEESLQQVKTLGFRGLESVTPLSPSLSLFSPSTEIKPQQEKSYFQISEFVQLIQAVIKNHLNQTYWICGEISSLKTANGHVFFDLIEKDEKTILSEQSSYRSLRAASISCILWAGRRKSLQEKMEQIPFADGTQIKIKVGVDFRKEGARIMAIVEDLDSEHTKGNLLLQRQSIVQELKKRNLYQKNKSSFLIAFPIHIALFTAENSRACADFLDELRLSQIAFKVTLFDCNMQGEKTSENIVAAFQKMESMKVTSQFHCVVITRGGGSKLDLRWFDDLEIAKQIAHCTLPVLTAVGHFDDISIADEISFRSEKTPTAAARFLSNKVQESFSELFTRIENMSRIVLRRFEKERQGLHLIEQKCALYATRRLQAERKNLERLEQFLKIFTSSIEKTMERGFCLVYDSSGNVLTGQHFLQSDYPKNLELRFTVENKNEKTQVQVQVTTQNVTLSPIESLESKS